MTYRPNDFCSKSSYKQSQLCLNQQNRVESMDEGCPVIEESGSVCGESDNLCIFQEFRKIYDDCIRKLERNQDGNLTLKKLAPFKKLVEDLWEQNNMLVETVEELEQEASCTVTNLQNQLIKSSEKDLHCKLKAKERELECLSKELSEKDDLLKKYCCQIEELKRDIKEKNKKYKGILKQLKFAAWKEYNRVCDNKSEDPQDDGETELEELVNTLLNDIETQRKHQFEDAESQLKAIALENNRLLTEKSEIDIRLQCLTSENEKLVKEVAEQKICNTEKEELLNSVEQLNLEKTELIQKLNCLHENIQELNSSFKETRWALTSEVAEKHDQVQELRRCVSVLEEQLRQADMQTHFKDDIIKELRKELKSSRKSERRGLYDVVAEVRSRKNMKNETCSASICDCDAVSKCQSGTIRPDSSYNPGTTCTKGKENRIEGINENKNDCARLQSQLDCLKSTLKLRVEQLREQEELTRDLEDELARAKMDLAILQGKYEGQERRPKAMISFSEPCLSCHYKTLSCAASKIEQTLKILSQTYGVETPNCKIMIDQEMEKIISVKNDLKTLEANASKSQCKGCSTETIIKRISEPCENIQAKGRFDSEFPNECNSIHVGDVESFQEKVLTGVATLEEMKEQVDILGNVIRKYVEEFPCESDRIQVVACEEKFEELRAEFDIITDQLCTLIGKLNKGAAEGSYNESLKSCRSYVVRFKEDESVNTQINFAEEDIGKLRCECQRLQKEISDQENRLERLKILSNQLEEELQTKKNELAIQACEIDSRADEITALRKLVKRVGCQLKQLHSNDVTTQSERVLDRTSACITSTLSSLFSDLKELWCILENLSYNLFENPNKLKEDNEKLKEKLVCLEKCICNKEETLKVVQDTVKLRECQIEELRMKMQSSESQTSKLAQDVEEKCRLIGNLQEAVRKCKQFEVNVRSPQVESLKFEVCELDNKLKKSEKEILFRDAKLESLHDEIIALSSKNFLLSQEIKLNEPRLKTLYKTCHLFEKMVSDLQTELNNRECEVESLYMKIKELEEELESEFQKCEGRASEDLKCIEELNVALKNLQNELCCAKENYNAAVNELEEKLNKEREMSEVKELELNNIISNLKEEMTALQNRIPEDDVEDENLAKITDLERIIEQRERQQQMYERKINELQKVLECTVLEHEEERKNFLQKLCEEKRENMKNKTLITKLNENMKRKMVNEKTLKECITSFTKDNDDLRVEIQELRTEIEARRKVMSAMEREEVSDLSKLEEVLCHLKIQKEELKSRCFNLKDELDKEVTLKKLLECRVEDLNAMLERKIQEFCQVVENYKCSSSKLQQILTKLKETGENFLCVENNVKRSLNSGCDLEESEFLRKLVDVKTAENAKLISRLEILKVEMEAYQIETSIVQAKKDSQISSLKHEVNCLDNSLQELERRCQKLSEENKIFEEELNHSADKEAFMQTEYMEKQKELCCKLRTTICEKNSLLNSVDELHKQLEEICLENASKEKITRELVEECSRLKTNIETNDSYMNSKTDKIICNLTKEVKSLQCENCDLKENYNLLSEQYQSLLDQFKCCEKKKSNLEKLYVDGNNENRDLQELRATFEKELCELQTQNLFLKDKLAVSSKSENFNNSEEKKKLCVKIKELTLKIKSLEKRMIPDLEHEIAEKNCYIENLKAELREANISSQRMRNEALRVIQHTKKYLAAQRYANETLKSRLVCSNKRGNILGAENRELEEQLKAVTRMNEFLLCQLESSKSDVEVEPRSFSPLPWGCSTVERDTSSSEYLAESGIQSMQQSPTNMDCNTNDFKFDSKRTSPQWNSLKRNKYGGSVEYPSSRNGVR